MIGGTDYDEKVDVYSFAMILYELIFGEIPFEDSDPKQMTALVADGTRPSIEDPPPLTLPRTADRSLGRPGRSLRQKS